MADKDINIHVRTPGSQEAQLQINKVADAVNDIGASIEKITPGVEQASGVFSKFMGFFSAGLLLGAAKKAVDFFDNVRKSSDRAVEGVENLRKAYDGLFEALNKYDERGRRSTVIGSEKLLAETSTPGEIGIPAIESYTRQFKDIMQPQDYQIGMRKMLSYAARHGGEATPDLLQMMRGWGINTSAGQSEMYRLVTAASEQAGLTDEEMVSVMGRASPVAKKLKWGPQQTISTSAVLAAGEIGRNKTMRPTTILEEYAKNPRKAIKDYPVLGRILPISPVSEEADAAEAAAYSGTTEARAARSKAMENIIDSDLTQDDVVRKNIRDIGKKAQERFRRQTPVSQWFRELFILGDTAEQEDAAYHIWEENLTPQQRAYLQKKYPARTGFAGEQEPATAKAWGAMSGQQRLHQLQSMNISYHNDTYINQTPPAAQMRTDPNDM